MNTIASNRGNCSTDSREKRWRSNSIKDGRRENKRKRFVMAGARSVSLGDVVCTRATVNIRLARSLQRGKTEGTKSIVSKVIYGRGGVYQFASGGCERAWRERARTSRELPTTRTPRTSTSRRSRTNDHRQLSSRAPSPARPSIGPHLIIRRFALLACFEVAERERGRRWKRGHDLGYLPLKLSSLELDR